LPAADEDPDGLAEDVKSLDGVRVAHEKETSRPLLSSFITGISGS
jgi:hypothetical protein